MTVNLGQERNKRLSANNIPRNEKIPYQPTKTNTAKLKMQRID
jgi:hypothetical protein